MERVVSSPVGSGYVAGSRFLSLSPHSLLLLSDRVPAVAVRHLHCRRLRAEFYVVQTCLRIAGTMKKPSPRKYARYAVKFNDSSLRTAPVVSLHILRPDRSFDGLFRTRGRG